MSINPDKSDDVASHLGDSEELGRDLDLADGDEESETSEIKSDVSDEVVGGPDHVQTAGSVRQAGLELGRSRRRYRSARIASLTSPTPDT